MGTKVTTAPQFVTIHRHAPGLGLGDAILLWLRRGWARRRTEAALHGLSDAVLRDIGVERYQIPTIARRMAEESIRRPGVTFTDVAAVPAATANRSPVPPTRADAA